MVLSQEKVRVYGVHEDFALIYKEYLGLLAGRTDLDPRHFEVDFLTHAVATVKALAAKSNKVG